MPRSFLNYNVAEEGNIKEPNSTEVSVCFVRDLIQLFMLSPGISYSNSCEEDGDAIVEVKKFAVVTKYYRGVSEVPITSEQEVTRDHEDLGAQLNHNWRWFVTDGKD